MSNSEAILSAASSVGEEYITVRSANAAEIEVIRSLLSIEGRFVLASVLCDDLALEREAIGQLMRTTPEICIAQMACDSQTDPFTIADQTAPQLPAAVFVTGLTSWLSDEDRRHTRARALNASREKWSERFHCPVLLWMNHTSGHLLAQLAPDIWRYRSHRFVLEAEASEQFRASVMMRLEASGLESAADARERIDELLKRINSVASDAPNSLLELANRWRNELGLLYLHFGELDTAEQAWSKALEVSRQLANPKAQAALLGNLGLIAQTQGNLGEAERLYGEALAISRAVGWMAGQSIQLGNLGVIAQNRGSLAEAEKLCSEALAIDRKLGRMEGQAAQLSTLGLLAWTRGNLREAEKFHSESLEIERKRGSLGGQAAQLGNLGLIARARNDVDEAEKLFRESLEIERKLGRLEGQAAQLGNLGLIARVRGDLDKADTLLHESLEIDRKLGRLWGQANHLGNLGLIARTRGNLDEAERLHLEALEIDRKLGRLEHQAGDIANLGQVAECRGRTADARRLWTKSRDLYARVGMPHRVKQVQDRLDALPPE